MAIDTTLGACSAAVGDEGGPIAARFVETATGQAELLVPMIESVLKEAGLAPRALGRIAVTVGPGSFAGTRIGLSAAQAMARVLGIPMVGLTSLEAVALTMEEAVPRVVAFDARKNELYLQEFGARGEARAAPMALGLEAAWDRLRDMPENTVLLGSGAAALGAHLDRAVIPTLWPEAAAFVAHAARKPAATELPLKPLYLRAPGALPFRRMEMT